LAKKVAAGKYSEGARVLRDEFLEVQKLANMPLDEIPWTPLPEADNLAQPDTEKFYGLLGDITRFVAPQSEADPAAIFFQLMAFLAIA
jgi:hypothetical protein